MRCWDNKEEEENDGLIFSDEIECVPHDSSAPMRIYHLTSHEVYEIVDLNSSHHWAQKAERRRRPRGEKSTLSRDAENEWCQQFVIF